MEIWRYFRELSPQPKKFFERGNTLNLLLTAFALNRDVFALRNSQKANLFTYRKLAPLKIDPLETTVIWSQTIRMIGWVLAFALSISAECPWQDQANKLCYDSEAKKVLYGPAEGFTGPLDIPNTVTTIAQDAFNGAEISGDLVISGSVDCIESNAFYMCKIAGTITIGPSVKTIKNQAFCYTEFKSMEIEADGLRIEGATGTASAAISANGDVTVRGTNVFLGTQAIWSSMAKGTKITLRGTNFELQGGNSKAAIGAQYVDIDVNDSIFGMWSTTDDLGYMCPWLGLSLSGDNNYFDSTAIKVGNNDGNPDNFWVNLTRVRTKGILGQFFCPLKRVAISVLEIGTGALTYMTKTETVELSICEGCTTIPEKAFMDLPVKGRITFPSSVTKIASNAFDNTQVDAFFMENSNGVYGTFDGVLYTAEGDQVLLMPPMKSGSFHLPATLTRLPSITESTWPSISYITVDEGNPQYFSENGVLCEKNNYFAILVPRALEGDLVVPSRAIGISATAFQGCTKLNKITVGTNIKTIAGRAFFEVSFGTLEITASELTLMKDALYCAMGDVVITGSDVRIETFGAYLYRSSKKPVSIKITGSNYYFAPTSVDANSISIDVDDSTMVGEGTSTGNGIMIRTEGRSSVSVRGERNLLEKRPLTCSGTGSADFVIDLRHTAVGSGTTGIGKISGFDSVFISFDSLASPTLTKDTIDECNKVEFVINDGVTVIPWRCFYEAKYLTSFKIPRTVSTIEREAFLGCSGITAFEVEGDNFKVEDGVIYDKSLKILIVFPEGKSGTFRLPSTVEELWVTPNSFPKIDYFDVSDNPRFESPNGMLVDKIEKKIIVVPKAKQGQALTIPESIEIIGTYAFSFCTWGIITIGKNVKVIEDYAFKGANFWDEQGAVITCESLEIGVGAFQNITGRIEINGTGLHVKKEGLYVSELWTSASALLLADSQDYYLSISGTGHSFDSRSLYASKLKIDVADTVFQNWTLMTPRAYQTFTAFSLKGDNCETYYNAFSIVNCDEGSDKSAFSIELTNLKAHDRLGTLSNLGVVNVSFSSIEGSPLSGVTGTEKLTVGIGDDMGSLDEGAFGGDGTLTGEFTIPKTVHSISPAAFAGQYNIEKFIVDPGNPVYTSEHGVVMDKAKTTIVLFPEGKTGEYTLPSTVVAIDPENHKFSKITKLHVSGSSTLSEQNGILFSGDGTKVVRCPGGWTGEFACTAREIGPYSFSSCTLENALIGSDCRVIGSHAFEGCTCKQLSMTGDGKLLGEKCLYNFCGDVTVKGSNHVFSNESIYISVRDGNYQHFLKIEGRGHEFCFTSVASMITYIDTSDSLFHTSFTDAGHSQNIFHLTGDNNTFQVDAIGVSQSSPNIESIDRVLTQTKVRSEGSLGTLEGFKTITISFAEMKGESTMVNVKKTEKLSVEFLEGLTSIPTRAFYDVDDLEGAVVLPSTLTDVYAMAFSQASRITEVRFLGEEQRQLASGVLRIAAGAFSNCGALARVIFERHENSVVLDESAFAGHITGFEVVFTKGTETPEPPAPDGGDDIVIILVSVIVPVVVVAAIVIFIILFVMRQDKKKERKGKGEQAETADGAFTTQDPFGTQEWDGTEENPLGVHTQDSFFTNG